MSSPRALRVSQSQSNHRNSQNHSNSHRQNHSNIQNHSHSHCSLRMWSMVLAILSPLMSTAASLHTHHNTEQRQLEWALRAVQFACTPRGIYWGISIALQSTMRLPLIGQNISIFIGNLVLFWSCFNRIRGETHSICLCNQSFDLPWFLGLFITRAYYPRSR